MKVSAIKLFLIFAKIGAILLGGGYVILPLIISEFSEKRNLLKEDEIMEFFALSQTIPGILAANISIFIGYKLKGFWGAIAAMFGIIFAPLIFITLIWSIINLLSNNNLVQSILTGIGLAVIVLIFITIKDFWQRSCKNFFFYTIFSLALVLLLLFEMTPVKTIIILSVLGVLIKFFTKNRVKKGDCE